MTTVSTVSSYSRGRGLMLLAAVVAVIVLIVLYGGRDDGMPGGGERFVTLTVAQEITLGQQALPELAVLYGGVTPNAAHQALGARVGQHIASQGLPKKTGYRFGFTVLGDDTVLDAFALPGGQVAITDGMVNRMKTEGQLAAVLALQIAHVMSRHPTELLATNSANDPKANPDASLQERFSSFSAQLSAMKFTPAQVLEADRLAVRLMGDAGYDPRAMLSVLQILAGVSRQRQVEFFVTHPNATNRWTNLQQAIAELYPQGVPEFLSK